MPAPSTLAAPLADGKAHTRACGPRWVMSVDRPATFRLRTRRAEGEPAPAMDVIASAQASRLPDAELAESGAGGTACTIGICLCTPVRRGRPALAARATRLALRSRPAASGYRRCRIAGKRQPLAANPGPRFAPPATRAWVETNARTLATTCVAVIPASTPLCLLRGLGQASTGVRALWSRTWAPVQVGHPVSVDHYPTPAYPTSCWAGRLEGSGSSSAVVD